MGQSFTRRQLLRHGALLPLVGIPLLSGCGKTGTACVDPELLGIGERAMRKTLQYVEVSADATRQCGVCEFFHGLRGCGHCEIINGEVSREGHCRSWAERTEAVS